MHWCTDAPAKNHLINLKIIFMKKILYFSLVAVMFMTACQSGTKTTSIDTNADADAIRKLETQWTIVNQTKDIEKNMGFYSPDALFMMPNEPIYAGIETIRNKVESMFADSATLWETYSWTNDTIEVSASGDLAYVRGSSRTSRKTPNGLVEDAGKGVDIWKKENGEWKCVLSIWNSDEPVEGR
jgi:ketosteroid isomerase-like protein